MAIASKSLTVKVGSINWLLCISQAGKVHSTGLCMMQIVSYLVVSVKEKCLVRGVSHSVDVGRVGPLAGMPVQVRELGETNRAQDRHEANGYSYGCAYIIKHHPHSNA